MAKDSKPVFRRARRLALPLHKAVETVTRPAFRKHGIAESRIITEWAHIAGGVLAGKTLPTRIAFARGKRDHGTLHLTVSPGWALEVQHLEPLILDKIATFFGYRAVAKLHITQAPLPLPEPPRRRKPETPLSAEDSANLTRLTDGVEDDELRRALESLGTAILREKPSGGV